MSKYEEALKVINDCCGNGKDNVISLSTIVIDKDGSAAPAPAVRDVDAMYIDGVFYVTTWALSNKILQIGQNKNVAICVGKEGIYGSGIGENLGWVLDEKNAEIRTKLRTVFADWYDLANDEENKNCIILAIRLKEVTIMKDHGAIYYEMDFVNKTAWN